MACSAPLDHRRSPHGPAQPVAFHLAFTPALPFLEAWQVPNSSPVGSSREAGPGHCGPLLPKPSCPLLSSTVFLLSSHPRRPFIPSNSHLAGAARECPKLLAKKKSSPSAEASALPLHLEHCSRQPSSPQHHHHPPHPPPTAHEPAWCSSHHNLGLHPVQRGTPRLHELVPSSLFRLRTLLQSCAGLYCPTVVCAAFRRRISLVLALPKERNTAPDRNSSTALITTSRRVLASRSPCPTDPSSGTQRTTNRPRRQPRQLPSSP